MDLRQTLNELRAERDRIEFAIMTFERLAASGGRRRGRPPAWMTALKENQDVPKRRGRPPGRKNGEVEA